MKKKLLLAIGGFVALFLGNIGRTSTKCREAHSCGIRTRGDDNQAQ